MPEVLLQLIITGLFAVVVLFENGAMALKPLCIDKSEVKACLKRSLKLLVALAFLPLIALMNFQGFSHALSSVLPTELIALCRGATCSLFGTSSLLSVLEMAVSILAVLFGAFSCGLLVLTFVERKAYVPYRRGETRKVSFRSDKSSVRRETRDYYLTSRLRI